MHGRLWGVPERLKCVRNLPSLRPGPLWRLAEIGALEPVTRVLQVPEPPAETGPGLASLSICRPWAECGPGAQLLRSVLWSLSATGGPVCGGAVGSRNTVSSLWSSALWAWALAGPPGGSGLGDRAAGPPAPALGVPIWPAGIFGTPHCDKMPLSTASFQQLISPPECRRPPPKASLQGPH